MNSADAMTVVNRIWNERTLAMHSARREQTIAHLERREEVAKVFALQVSTLENEVDALAFVLDLLMKVPE